MKKFFVLMLVLVVSLLVISGCSQTTDSNDDGTQPPSLPENVEDSAEDVEDLSEEDLQPPALPED